jgi:hypothetical protein
VEDVVTHNHFTLTVNPLPAGVTLASLKKNALESKENELVVESGDLPRGFWTDVKKNDNRHVVTGVVVGKYMISCLVSVRDEKALDSARAVCKSLKTF